MKPRRVFITLEVETGHALSTLRNRSLWDKCFERIRVLQVQANVAKAEKKKAKKK